MDRTFSGQGETLEGLPDSWVRPTTERRGGTERSFAYCHPQWQRDGHPRQPDELRQLRDDQESADAGGAFSRCRARAEARPPRPCCSCGDSGSFGIDVKVAGSCAAGLWPRQATARGDRALISSRRLMGSPPRNTAADEIDPKRGRLPAPEADRARSAALVTLAACSSRS